MKSRVLGLARAAPVRGALERAGDIPGGRRWLNRIAGANGVFSNFAEARQAAAKLGLGGHEEPTQSECYSHVFRQSDYPVLYWLSRIAFQGQARTLLDFGGALGALHGMYCEYLEEVASIDWIVYDLPDIVDRARYGGQRRDAALRFTSELSEGAGCDVLLASGSLHYWEHSVADLFEALGSFPKHVLINRSPVTSEPSYVIVQRLPQVALPCIVRNRAALIDEFEHLGYTLVGDWTEPGRRLTIPLFPRYDVAAYSGFYFRLRDLKENERQERR